MSVVAGTRSSIGEALYSSTLQYRYDVFVTMLGWNMDCPVGRESDQFDRDDTHYVVLTRDNSRIVGISRLLPTTKPYLLRDVFPELLGDTPAPSACQSWELSRFAAVDLTSDINAQQVSSPAAVTLLRASLREAARLGAREVVTVSPVGVERLLRQAGFNGRNIASPRSYEDGKLFACRIQCT